MFIYTYLFLQISQYEDNLKAASLVCIDGNLSVEAIEYICLMCNQNEIPGKDIQRYVYKYDMTSFW